MVNELIELPLCFIIRYLYGEMNWLVSPINSRNLADSIYVSAACLSLPPVSHTLTLPKPVSLLHSNLLAKPLHLPLQGHLPQAPVNHLQERLLGFSSNCIQFPKCCSTIIILLWPLLESNWSSPLDTPNLGLWLVSDANDGYLVLSAGQILKQNKRPFSRFYLFIYLFLCGDKPF